MLFSYPTLHAAFQYGAGFLIINLLNFFIYRKICVRLLFGTELTFNHPEYYLTCARARTYTEHTATKNFVLEHTKPLLNENGFLSLGNLYSVA